MRESERIGRDLLAWYDAHARELAWRVGPAAARAGVRPDPYHVWLSEIMLQQTTVAAVRGYFEVFTRRWPDVHALAAADDEAVMRAWAGLGYYARARNLLACARIVSGELGGTFPRSAAELRRLPGIGPYTASAIAAIAFDEPVPVVDGNVERVVARLRRIDTPLPAAKPEVVRHTEAMLTPDRPGDFAQACMDLGATVCLPRGPRCGACPLRTHCRAATAGDAERYPVKPPKKPKPVRHGCLYVGRRADGAVLLVRRPDRGLLGGMLGFPGSEWAETPAEAPPPFAADWREIGEVRHTFTHFHLRLKVLAAKGASGPLAEGEWRRDIGPDDLPTVMAKAWRLARAG